MSRPLLITGCFEFRAPLVWVTLLGRTPGARLHFHVRGHPVHSKSKLKENGLILRPYNHRLNCVAGVIKLKIPLRIFK